MSDIKHRLNDLGIYHRSRAIYGGAGQEMHERYQTTAFDAVAEIERLEAENERLRSSLRIIASHDPPWLDDHIRAGAALGR